MKIGLVLSGGGAKGAYQAGFLKAIEDTIGRKNISVVSSASIGMFNSYMFCKDKTDDLIKTWRDIHFDSMSDMLWELWFKDYLGRTVCKLTSPDDVLNIPMYSPICYLPTFSMRYNKLIGKFNPKWPKFLKGAISYPIFAGPFRSFRHQLAIDGGAMDNIPVYPCINPTREEEKPDVILVLHLLSHYRVRKEFTESGIPIIDYDVSISNKFRKHFFDFHADTIEAMLDRGYEYGRDICTNVFADVNDLDRVIAAAALRRKEEAEARFDARDGDLWIQKLNEMFYPIVRQCRRKFIDLTYVEKAKRKRKAKRRASRTQTEGLK